MILFILDKHKIKINAVEVLLFEEFRILYERDLTNDKEQVFKEFNFIYQSCDLKSAPNKEGLTGDDLEDKARDIARLPVGWKPDIEIRNAMLLYMTTTPSIGSKLLKEILISMNFSVTILQKLRKQVAKMLETSELTVDQLTTLENAIDKIMTIAGSFNKHMKTLKETEDMIVAEENKDVIVGRGNKIIKDSMNVESSM